jgi:hypothetical protein
MKRFSMLVLTTLSIFALAESKEVQGNLDEVILLEVGDIAVISDFRITLVSVNDDGCGRARECVWIQFNDAIFQVWQGEQDLGEIALSTTSRENSQRFVQLGDYYIVLKNTLGYETDIDTAEFYVTKTLERYVNQD